MIGCKESPDMKSWFTGKYSDARKDWEQEEKGVVENEVVGMTTSIPWTQVWKNSRR